MSHPSSHTCIRGIAAIVGLVLVLSLLVVEWISSLNPYLSNSQIPQFVIDATIQYRLKNRINNFIVGTVGVIIAYIIFRYIIVGNPIAVFSRLSRNKGILIIILSFVLLDSGMLLIAVGQHTNLNCERSKNTCTLVTTGLWGSKTQRLPLQTLKGAYVQTDDIETDGGQDTVSRVALLTTEGEIRLTDQPYKYGLHEETAKQINAFMARPQQESLRVYEDNRQEFLIGGVLWILVSVVVFGVGCLVGAG